MPIIPDLTTSSDGTWRQAAPDPGVAASAEMANAGIGRVISDIGNKVTQLGMQMKRVREQDAMNRAKIAFGQAQSRHAEFRLRNPDQTQWEGNLQSELASARESVTTDNLTPSGRQAVDSQWGAWSADAIGNTQVDAVKFEVTRARQNEANLVESYARAGDFGSARGVLSNSAISTPEERDAKLLDLQDKETAWKSKQVDAMILTDPRGAKSKIESGAFGLNDYEKAVKLERANKGIVADDHDVAFRIQDGIASGEINSPQQIDSLGIQLRPAVREQLKEDLASKAARAANARLKSKEHLDETIGWVKAQMDDYDPKADQGEETHYLEIRQRLLDLPPSAPRTKYLNDLEKIRRTADPANAHPTYADYAQTALDESHKKERKALSDGVASMPTARAIADGFLINPANLTAQGFSKAQAEEIAGKKTDLERLTALRDMWAARENPQINPGGFKRAAIDAILGGEKEIRYADPEAAIQADKKRGDLLRRQGEQTVHLIEWLRLNPNASPEQIDGKIKEIGGAGAVRGLKTSIIQSKSGDSIPGSTTSVDFSKSPIKLSNYGYASDTTPDSNSMRGIGHRNNRLESGVDAAITRSLANRLGLKHGDWFEIATTQGTLKRRYGDTVPSYDDRTGPLPETIDLFQRDGSNSFGGKVLSLTKLS